jgi:hypothetical protein
MNTATCAECDHGWRGNDAPEHGLEHEKQTGHVVWFDDNPDASDEWEGVVQWKAVQA